VPNMFWDFAETAKNTAPASSIASALYWVLKYRIETSIVCAELFCYGEALRNTQLVLHAEHYTRSSCKVNAKSSASEG
jgi:hypothetical protein